MTLMDAMPDPGSSTTIQWSFSQSDFDRFARLSGDNNPIHVDPVFSAQTHFGRTVAHGMLLFSVLCGRLHHAMIQPSGLVVAQEMMFTAPTYADEKLLISLTLKGVNRTLGTSLIETAFRNPDGSFGLIGHAEVYGGETVTLPQLAEMKSSEVVESEAERYKGMVLGQTAEKKRAFSTTDLVEYADLAGDQNPLFIDVAAARELGLANLMIPLPLLCGLFSDLLGTQLPGRGTNWLKLKVGLNRPAIVNEVITAVVEIIRLRPQKDLVNLKTRCVDQEGHPICVGEALVLTRDVLEGENTKV
jgi:acyl dehydratase